MIWPPLTMSHHIPPFFFLFHPLFVRQSCGLFFHLWCLNFEGCLVRVPSWSRIFVLVGIWTRESHAAVRHATIELSLPPDRKLLGAHALHAVHIGFGLWIDWLPPCKTTVSYINSVTKLPHCWVISTCHCWVLSICHSRYIFIESWKDICWRGLSSGGERVSFRGRRYNWI